MEEDDDEGSVTRWFGHLKRGDHVAAQPLWERYFDRLVRLARGKLDDGRGLAAYDEDVALSAFDSFIRAAGAGRYPRLDDRDDLWKSLVTITARKAIDLRNHSGRQKRGGGRVLDEAALDVAGGEMPANGLDNLAGDEPTPEFAALVAEQYRILIESLGDETLRKVATWKLEGFTNVEIAGKLGRSLRLVAYKLELIRALWERDDPAGS